MNQTPGYFEHNSKPDYVEYFKYLQEGLEDKIRRQYRPVEPFATIIQGDMRTSNLFIREIRLNTTYKFTMVWQPI